MNLSASLNIGCGSDGECSVRLDIRKENTKANLFADANYLPFRPRSFAFIKAKDILEHLETPPAKMIHVLGRLVIDGGLILVVTPSENGCQLLIEVLYLAKECAKFLSHPTRKHLSDILKGIRHTIKFKRRILGDPTTTGCGGHKWLIKIGTVKTYHKIPHKYIQIIRRVRFVSGSVKLRHDDGKGNALSGYFMEVFPP